MMRVLLVALPVVLCPLVAACDSETIDTTGLPTVDDYPTWSHRDFSGPLAGHGTSYRIVYINDVAESYGGGGRYPVGTVLVKEVHALADDGTAGGLRQVAIMRKLPDDATEPTDAGWLFTTTSSPGGRETLGQSCYATCHQAAPFDGAFAAYGR
jgi:hypothetical protein